MLGGKQLTYQRSERMADDVGLRDVQRIEEQRGVVGKVRIAIAAGRRLGFAVPAQIERKQPPLLEEGRNQRPAAAVVGVSMQEKGRRSLRIAHFTVSDSQSVGELHGLFGICPLSLT